MLALNMAESCCPVLLMPPSAFHNVYQESSLTLSRTLRKAWLSSDEFL